MAAGLSPSELAAGCGSTRGQIVHLNVGGQRFSTSRHTLTAVPDTFFTSLLSGRISSLEDESGALFVDRDPELFRLILNYLRNRSLSLQYFPPSPQTDGNLRALLHEAEYYGISPLVKQLTLCNELDSAAGGCGGVLFHSFLPPPSLVPPPPAAVTAAAAAAPIGGGGDPLRVQMVRAHQNSIAVAYSHFVACYKQRETASGFQLSFTSPHLDRQVERVAINSSKATTNSTMIAVSCGTFVRLMGFADDGGGDRLDVGTFDLQDAAPIDQLFFIGTQLVALSTRTRTGKIGVWNAVTRHWQSQSLSAAITSHDTAGSLLLIGSANGHVSYVDVQKFPLRMKDNDLLVTELYRDPNLEPITSISVYLTPKTPTIGNWIEFAYGTGNGVVRVIVHHPETVGQGPQLFQTFTVHRSPVTKVKLSEELLVSVCSEDNHVRTWSVTRFRGTISTQPGSTSISSFKVMSLTAADCGPYGEQDDRQIFVQHVIPETNTLLVRAASNGERICTIGSVDGTAVTSFCVHECEGSSRVGSRSRRFVITGHSNGAVQLWDLSTALDLFTANKTEGGAGGGGPTRDELVKMLHYCDLSNSASATPVACISPSSSDHHGPTGKPGSASSQTTTIVIN